MENNKDYSNMRADGLESYNNEGVENITGSIIEYENIENISNNLDNPDNDDNKDNNNIKNTSINTNNKYSTIRISLDVKSLLDNLKTHPRQSYNEVIINKIISNDKL